MKNQYDISEDGRTVTIWCYGRGAYHGCLIDIEDLPKVDSVSVSWEAKWHDRIQEYYVRARVRENGKRRTVFIHRLITDAPSGLVVDHKNHIPLDNRRKNLRVTTYSGNAMNRLGARSDSKTGHRGIFLQSGRFIVRGWIGLGNFKYIGSFSTIEEAMAARDQTFPEYARSA